MKLFHCSNIFTSNENLIFNIYNLIYSFNLFFSGVSDQDQVNLKINKNLCFTKDIKDM